MAEANLTLPNGTVVKVKGSSEEIAKIMSLYNSGVNKEKDAEIATVEKSKTKIATSKRKKGQIDFIRELIKDGFFKEKRSLSQVQKKLEEEGHIYAQTSLSPYLLLLTKGRELRRIREKGVWIYVNR